MVEASVSARILVAEDDVVVGRDIEESLGTLGYEVAGVVRTGEEAVQAARELEPDLVLMDVRMPGLVDGVEAAHRIREHMELPVVYLTAYSDDRTVARAKETGPFGYVVKPFDDQELKTAIELAIYRHRMKRLVEKSRERYRRLFEDDIAAHYVATPDGKILAANRAFVDLVGAEGVDEVLDLDARALYPSEAEREELLERIRDRGEVRSYRASLVRRDGESVPVLENVRGWFEDDGRLKEIHANLVDMARERKLEEQVRRAARMEAAGRLAGGIAHDFNSLLTSIRGTADLLAAEEELSERGRNDLRTIVDTCERASDLVQGLFAAGGGSYTRLRQPVDLSDLVHDMYDVLSRLLGAERELFVSVGGGPLVVQGVAPELEQVLLNLVVNARDAVSDGGRVKVRLEGAAEADGLAASTDAHTPGWVRLTVSDDGKGMDPDTRERIFDPFYSTKEEGTGLGLAAVYGIVRDHGGDVVVDSEPDRGAAFHVYLPRGSGAGSA